MKNRIGGQGTGKSKIPTSISLHLFWERPTLTLDLFLVPIPAPKGLAPQLREGALFLIDNQIGVQTDFPQLLQKLSDCPIVDPQFRQNLPLGPPPLIGATPPEEIPDLEDTYVVPALSIEKTSPIPPTAKIAPKKEV